MNNTITAAPIKINDNHCGTTHTDVTIFPVFKQPTLEEQIAALRNEIDELRQELTVIKTLLPSPAYVYPMTNASE